MEGNRNDGNYIETLIICVFFRVTSLLHYAFGVLWRVRFDITNDEIPPELIKMKDNVRLATWLAIQLCTCMVCLKVLYIFCVVYTVFGLIQKYYKL